MEQRDKCCHEAYRPGFHYTAQSHIINDPNGLVFYEGEYHLMYQYNIHDHIHWGHAVSTDLLHWEHLSPALAPDAIGQIWFGSAVVDWHNTSGLQYGKEKVMIALFTYNEHIDSQQSQGLAYSSDRGRTWHKYKNNLVLTSEGKKDFRDPKVFWHTPSSRWIMVLACFDHVEFYHSFNLTDWKFSGEFGQGEGSHSGIWECPDLFELPIENNGEDRKWILTVSINNGAPAGGTGMQYFIGSFDGISFCSENPPQQVLWTDYGKDFYAGVTWNDIPQEDGRRLMIAWSDNWLYRDALPKEPFKGRLSSVRELYLKQTEDGIRLCQQPVRELDKSRILNMQIKKYVLEEGSIKKLSFHCRMLDFSCSLKTMYHKKGEAEIRISCSKSEYIRIGYDFRREILYVDRSHSGLSPHKEFSGIFEAPMTAFDDEIHLRILVDTSQIEVFGNKGAVVMTDLFFPKDHESGYEISISVEKTSVVLEGCEVYRIPDMSGDSRNAELAFCDTVSGSWADTIDGLEGDSGGTGIIQTKEDYYDFVINGKVKSLPYRDRRCFGIVFGSNDHNEKYKWILDADQKCIQLYYGEKLLKNSSIFINQERVYQVRISAVGKKLTVYLDKVEIMEICLEEYKGGRLGLYVNNTVAVFNDFKIEEVSGD